MHVDSLDFTGQRLGSAFVQELCRCLAQCRVAPAGMLLGQNELDDTAADALAEYVSPSFPGPLSRLVLERNGVTDRGAWTLVEAIPLCPMFPCGHLIVPMRPFDCSYGGGMPI